MFVTDLGFHQGLGPDQPSPNALSHPAGVKILTPTGQWLGGWGMSSDTPGDIIAGPCGGDGLERRPVCGRDAGRREGAEVRAGCVDGD